MPRPQDLISFSLSLFITAAGLAPIASADDPADRVAAAVRDLGADDFETRDQASRALWLAGNAAGPALRAAEDAADPEVRLRAREVLDRFEAGFTPDRFGFGPSSPPAIIDAVRHYNPADHHQSRLAILSDLFRAGPDAHPALLGIFAIETGRRLRRRIAEHLVHEAGSLLGRLLAQGGEETVEKLLEAAAWSGKASARRGYAALLILRDRLDAKIAEWKGRAEGDADPRVARILAYLFAAQGDLDDARRYADDSGHEKLSARLTTERDLILAASRSREALLRSLAGTNAVPR